MSFLSSTTPSHTSDSEALRRCSVDTNNTSTSEFLAAVATEPPRVEDYAGYPATDPHWPLPRRRTVEEPTDDLPSRERLREASSIPILDGDGNEVSFKDLYVGGNCNGERRLVLFIRHWYCWACQKYINYLKDLVPPSSSDGNGRFQAQTKIILIGCGSPSLINSYVQRTKCPYPVYTEPTLKLLKLLGCRRWGGVVWRFGKRPEYASDINAAEMAAHSLLDKYRSVFRDSLSGSDSSCCSSETSEPDHARPPQQPSLKKRPSLENLESGPIFQVGGEFLFENGQLIWCHRMKGMRTHTDIKTLRRVLEIEDETDMVEKRIESKWVEEELRKHEAQGRRPSKELRRKAEKLCKDYEASPAARKALSKPITDEEEDRYLERQLGRKPSLASVKNGVRVVREPHSARAHLTREEPKIRRRPAIDGMR